MGRQLVLIEERGADYKLDERTREVARKGIAAAREALRRGAAGGGDNGGNDHHGSRTAA